MLVSIREWFNGLFAKTYVCGVCSKTLDQDYGIIRYKIAGNEPTQEMKVCSECLAKMELDHQRFRSQIKDWKDDYGAI